MPGANASPTVRRWELAARLRKLREQHDLSVQQLAAELLCSSAKVSRMETAGRGVSARDIRDLARLYQLPNQVRDELTQLAAEASKRGWWQDIRTIDEEVKTYLGLEAAAREIRVVEAQRLPGLLQTENIVRALVPALRPAGEIDARLVEETVLSRRRRQERLASGEIQLHVVVDETAFRRPVGGPYIMVEQIERMLADASRDNVVLQVIPFARGPHPAMDGSFNHLTFPQEILSDVVYVEGLLGSFVLDAHAVVDHYRQVFDELAGSIALSPSDSASWLENVADDWRSITRRPRRAKQGG
jgi:transcriptional regulator with XRE-family HTH domain